MKEIVCFIPARSGSKRIPNKNIRDLCGNPLIAYTISVALESETFKKVYLVSDSEEYLKIGEEYGALPARENADKDWTKTRDFDWVKQMADEGILGEDDYFMILRPTNPFKTVETLKNAWIPFSGVHVMGYYTSLRAIKVVSQHPDKMWYVRDGDLFPLTSDHYPLPAYEKQTQQLKKYYVQAGTLEISHISILKTNTISGLNIFPYVCQDYEGFDINAEEDWILAEALIEKGMAKLPEVRLA